MHRNNPVFSALYRNDFILGVSNRFFASELIALSFILFAVKIYLLIIPLFTLHLITAFLNSRESEWIQILAFFLRLPAEKHAELP